MFSTEYRTVLSQYQSDAKNSHCFISKKAVIKGEVMTSLQLNEYERQYEMSTPSTAEYTEQSPVQENIAEQERAERTDIFTLARAISYRANARKRFSRATSVI